MFKRLKPCLLYNEAKIINDYQQAWRYQKVLTEHAGVERKKGNFVPDSMILVQHQSLYTLGRGATLDNLKFAPNEPGEWFFVLILDHGNRYVYSLYQSCFESLISKMIGSRSFESSNSFNTIATYLQRTFASVRPPLNKTKKSILPYSLTNENGIDHRNCEDIIIGTLPSNYP